HYGRLRSATISGGYYTIPGVVSLETIMKNLEKIAAEELPQSIRTTWAGETREFLDAQNATLAAFLLALFVVYLVLSAQFESFIHPIIIMLTVPLAVCGALVTLFISGASLNIYSQIGMILLIGLVTKNGILIVEYANRQLEENPEATIRQAIVQAANIRFRPILMTSIATIFGALPIAFGLGAGSESRQPLGLVVVGGMILSTFLTLYVVPMVYELMNRRLRAQ
ncbi:MAG: efflux RND transporter permease subunit, partial [Vampirovibrio sp.]|nr:efflux RND transporter permease subunit [Vampirovibrio sp.]